MIKKYSIILLSAIILERCSTMYITAVSDKEIAMMMLFAFVWPIIHLPFIWFMIDERRGKVGPLTLLYIDYDML